jgi:uncharacterized protein with HEPN domain
LIRTHAEFLGDARVAARAAMVLRGASIAVYDHFADRALVCYAVIQIAEALARLPNEVLSLAPNISKREIRAMRNRIVHVYWNVDASVLQNVVENDLGAFDSQIEQLLDRLASQTP